MEIVINGVKPMGAVRMTRKGKWTSEAAQRYLSYKNFLRVSMFDQLDNEKKFKPGEPLHVELIFKMPIPDSSTKKEKSELPKTPHMKKPDIDNLVKGVFDAINGILWADDNQVSSVMATKIYSAVPGIVIFIEPHRGGN